MSNPLLRLVTEGKIGTLEELRSAYRKLILKTHPDAVGSERHLESYLKLRSQYEEARAYLAELPRSEKSHRLAFFEQLDLIETLELPYTYHPDEHRDELVRAREAASEELSLWNKPLVKLYVKADREYTGLKREKPSGPYLKNALALNLRPLLHDIISYHLTGKELYARQSRQNLAALMHQVEKKGCTSLHEFLALLIDDMKRGPALFD